MSVVFYHPTIWDHLKRLAQSDQHIDPDIRSYILEFKNRSKIQDIPFWISRLLGGVSGIDRTGKLNKLHSAYLSIPKVDSFSKSFGQVCLETAEYFWMTENQIEVLWSGGIDSTAATLSLLETKSSNQTLTITCTQESIDEYPLFFNTYREFCNLVEKKDFMNPSYLTPDHIIITGDVGDQIFGHMAIFDDDIMIKDMPWQNIFNLNDPFKQSQLSAAAGSRPKLPWDNREQSIFLETIEDHCRACPFEIKTYFDLLWWLNFTFKVNYTTLRIPIMIAQENLKNATNIDLSKRKAFYLTDDFQRWSLTNHEQKIGDTVESYKQPAKDFIFSINGDEEYRKNKTKEASTKNTVSNNWFSDWKNNDDAFYLMLEDGSIFSKNNEITGDLINRLINI